MEERFTKGELFTLSDAARNLLPQPGGRPVAPSTLWRWSKKGVRMPDGSRIKLEVWHCGGSKYTTREACAEFIERQTQARQSPAEPDWPRRADDTDRRLRDAGLL